jgi:hypothetical protein
MKMLNTLTAAALALTALTAPALAGDNSCRGYVYVEGATGYISDPEGDFGSIVGNGDQCSFALNSKVGKFILPKCPVGWECDIGLPLEAKRMPITTTRFTIAKGCHGRCEYYQYDQNRNLVKYQAAGPAPVRDDLK